MQLGNSDTGKARPFVDEVDEWRREQDTVGDLLR